MNETQKLTYSSYLEVTNLLKLQKPLSDMKAHDEMLFIVIHQVYELWFKLVLHEIEATVPKLADGELVRTHRSLHRVNEIFHILVQQVGILETMTPVDFNAFRSKLNPASGFQSLQFRELELICGANPADYEKFNALEPEWKGRLEKRITGLTLHSALDAMLRKLKFRTAEDKTPEESILRVYHSQDVAAQQICESLIDLDEQFAMWRYRHVQMVERMIGRRPGTGGSLGVSYLETTLKKRFFPELWSARSLMGTSY